MLEAQIESLVVEKAIDAGYFVRKVQWIGRRNAPDRVFARKDRGQVYIEFKAPGKEARPGQQIEHREMRAAGFEVHEIDSIHDALRVLWLL